ncbi:MAG: UDP-N-acetylglucosamine--N-acetylmuramyl-(pentapeptide) pyrophosphoryl-undecaprenol N-acetylglucosamine transferase [Candidatus Komeilibacteria bacterium]
MKLVFTGGGTMGSVSPLIAEIDYLLSAHGFLPEDFLWIGTIAGPERAVVKKYNIKYRAIPAGKLRRYFAWQNLIDPLKVGAGLVSAWQVLRHWRPQVVVTAGSFVSVPVVLAAKILGIKILVHQLDLVPGLANRLMSRWADKVTVSWPELLDKFVGEKTEWVGTPIRREIWKPVNVPLTPKLTLLGDRPLLLVMGGGTGARDINELVAAQLPVLLKNWEIFHITGPNKSIHVDLPNNLAKYYQQREFVHDDLGYLIQAADVIVARAGIGTISEIMTMGKSAVIIPIPHSHQEINADYFSRHGAIIKLDQMKLTGVAFTNQLNILRTNKKISDSLKKNSKLLLRDNPSERLAQAIFALVK